MNAFRHGGRILICLCAALLSWLPSAAKEVENPILEIGSVEVHSPPCGEPHCRPVHTRGKIRSWLAALIGKEFDRGRVERRVERHYAYLGYEPEIMIRFQAGCLDLIVRESPAAVAEVAVDPDRILPHVPDDLLTGLPPIDRPHVLRHAIRAAPGDYANRDRMARDQYDLSLLGYQIVPIPEWDGGDPTSRTYAVTRQPRRRHWKEVQEREEIDLPVEPLQRRWISTSIDYSRRELVTARLYYERAHLFREFDWLEISPFVSEQLFGGIRYRLPWILPSSLTSWNLFAELNAYKEFTPDRLLADVETDEVREGGRFALGLEPFRHWNGHSLKGEAYVDKYHLDFGEFAVPINSQFARRKNDVPGAELNDVTILGVSFDYSFRHLFRSPRFWWRFTPRVEIATKSLNGDVAFRRIYGELHQHYAWSTGFELDMRWKGGVVDRDVPVFEEFSLGGADTLRGFLRDDFLGRRLATAQNDLWIPLPFRAINRDSRLLNALQRNLKTALIFDVGSVSFEDAREVRLARGIGLGIVYSAERSPLVVRADVAWGTWRGETRFYPYLSFARKW